MIRSLTKLFAFAICAQPLCADDFNRPDVAYTHDASKLGWYWQASGNGHWSLKDHRIHVNNADPSRQETDQVLYHTRVLLKSGDWSATVTVRSATAGHHAGMVFMVGANGNSHYQIGLKFGSNQLRILRSGAGGIRPVGRTNVTSSETFDTACFYTITAWSTVPNQFQWKVESPAGKVIASGNFNDAEYVSGYAGIIKNVGDGNPDICEFDDFYVREITVLPITRPHPRLLISAADVSLIKMAIQHGEEPRHTAWQNLKATADRIVRSAKAPDPYTGRDSLVFYQSARGAGSQASQLALAWLLGGNPAHAARAREILLAWARASPGPGTNFDPALRFANSGMDVARGASGLIYAYDFLYETLTPEERLVVEGWLRKLLPTIRTGIQRWEKSFKLSSSDPRGFEESNNPNNIYFYGQLYQNHLVSHAMGCLLIGYALGDRELVQFAVDSRENPRDFLELFEGMILMKGDTMINGGGPKLPAPQDGEIIDRYRQVENHGLAYATLSLNQMMAMSETLFANGINPYNRVGAHGETLEKPFDFYADFYRLKDSSIKGGYYKGAGIGVNQIAVFEVANQRYPGNPNIEALLKSVDRAKIDFGGSSETYFCKPTLTHGVPLLPAKEEAANPKNP
jgi:hypothetical protein